VGNGAFYRVSWWTLGLFFRFLNSVNSLIYDIEQNKDINTFRNESFPAEMFTRRKTGGIFNTIAMQRLDAAQGVGKA
jgi:hypothetical protein